MHLKTPSVDIAPVKLYPYVKSKTQTQMHELASCFCPYQLYPYDTLRTYGVKQFETRAFFRVYSAIRLRIAAICARVRSDCGRKRPCGSPWTRPRAVHSATPFTAQAEMASASA